MPRMTAILSVLLFTIAVHAQSNSFSPGEMWKDNNGVHINAHGGGLLVHEGTYYWFGEHKIAGKAGNVAHVGVHCYSSKDLYNWKDEGIALKVSEEPKSDIAKGCILERPKVIFNKKTSTFVMYFHLELKGMRYQAARTGIATALKVTGPYTFKHSLRPNAGHWPVNVKPEQKDPKSTAKAKVQIDLLGGGPSTKHTKLNILRSHFEDGQQARDMTLFVDDDEKAYHLYSSEQNSTLHIALLSDDYQSHTGTYVRVFPRRWMEAPAIFKRKGKYYIIASGCSGWKPNAARSAVADNIFGPWKELENPCLPTSDRKPGPEMTFGGQSTYVLKVPNQDDTYIALFDEWRPQNAIDGRYLWLPIQFTGDAFKIPWRKTWTLPNPE